MVPSTEAQQRSRRLSYNELKEFFPESMKDTSRDTYAARRLSNNTYTKEDVEREFRNKINRQAAQEHSLAMRRLKGLGADSTFLK